jgi:RNA polymerase sigma-70 factor (ECF subfamily)
MKALSLLDLQRRFARGDEGAFEELMDATGGGLYRLARRLLGDRTEVEDVLQESYLRAFGALPHERFEADSGVHTWLCRVVTNVSFDLLRKGMRKPVSEPPAEAPDPARQTEARTRLRRLEAWIAELPAEQRAALVLKELEGMTNNEVAQVLGCSEGSVEQRLVRARRTLREKESTHDR